MTIADPITTLRAYLVTQTTVTDVVTTRVFGEELPGDEAQNMPREAIVLATSGGRVRLGAASNMDVGNYSIAVRCYHKTLYEARALDRIVYEAMMAINRWAVVGQGGLHYAVQDSGPFVMRDPDTDWPFALSTYNVMTGEVVHA